MSPHHRRYLVLEQGLGAAVFNFFLNGLIAWLIFRGATAVPFWGQQSIAGDTIGTCFMLPFLSCLIVTPLARRTVRARNLPPVGWTPASRSAFGWLPVAPLRRAVVLGALCMLIVAPPTLWLLGALGVEGMRLWPFLGFKAAFAAVLAAVVTPIIAFWAIAEAPAAQAG